MLTSDDIYSINVLVFEAVCKLMLIYMRQCLIKAAQFTNYVVCDPQERGEDGRWRKRERKRAGFSSGRPRRSFFFFVTAPLPAWLTAAAADIATLLLPSFCFNFIVTGQSGSREYEQNLLYHVLLFYFIFKFFQFV